MSDTAREQARHISETIQAYLDGKQIQSQSRFGSDTAWSDDETKTWDFVCRNYRVKPEERKPVEVTIIFQDGKPAATLIKGEPEDRSYSFVEVLPSENAGEI